MLGYGRQVFFKGSNHGGDSSPLWVGVHTFHDALSDIAPFAVNQRGLAVHLRTGSRFIKRASFWLFIA